MEVVSSVASSAVAPRPLTTLSSSSVRSTTTTSSTKSAASDNSPDSCTKVCEAASVAALKIGKTAALCRDDSDFMKEWQTCAACLESLSPSICCSLSDILEEYMSFCDMEISTSASWRIVSLSATTFSAALPVVSIPTKAGSNFTLTVDATTASSTPATLLLLDTSSITTPAAPTSTSTESSPASSAQSSSDGSTPSNNAWIAGPVIGSVVAVVLIVLVAFYIWRQRRLQQPAESTAETAQLDGAGVPEPEPEPKSELGSDGQMHEMGDANRKIHEMTDSVPASYLNYIEKPGDIPVSELPAEEIERNASGSSKWSSRSETRV